MSFMQLAYDRHAIKTVEVDTVTEAGPEFEDDFRDEVLKFLIEGRPITFRVVNPHGPGGGNPVVAFTGPDWALLEMLVAHYSLDVSEAFEMYGIGPAPDSPEPMDSLPSSVKLVGTPDQVIGIQDDPDVNAGWDWIAGYAVIRSAKGDHGGHEATRITLGDSDGNREVGRLVLRNDALRGSALEWVRQFESDEARDAFVASLVTADSKPAVLDGDGWAKVPVRTLTAGDLFLLEGDDDDPDVNDSYAPVTSVDLFVYEGAINVRVNVNVGEGTGFYPADYVEYVDPDLNVWAKRA